MKEYALVPLEGETHLVVGTESRPLSDEETEKMYSYLYEGYTLEEVIKELINDQLL